MVDEPDLQEVAEMEDPTVVPEIVKPKVVQSLFSPGSSPKDIIPLPKVASVVRKKPTRPQGQAFHLTGTPYKTMLESEIQKKKEKELDLAQKCQEREQNKKDKQTSKRARNRPSK